jgi:hypothetical protein
MLRAETSVVRIPIGETPLEVLSSQAGLDVVKRENDGGSRARIPWPGE